MGKPLLCRIGLHWPSKNEEQTSDDYRERPQDQRTSEIELFSIRRRCSRCGHWGEILSDCIRVRHPEKYTEETQHRMLDEAKRKIGL